jgi:hypothetical protein
MRRPIKTGGDSDASTYQNGQEFEIAIDAYDTVPTEGEK